MYVVIVGAGEVGSAIAGSLADTHDVAVVDIDGDRVEELVYDVDVLGVEGDGADLETLADANIERADILIASTDDDETNIVTCGTAMTVTDTFTISRVKSAKFLRTWEQSERAFGVDHMVATNLLTAEAITRVVGLPAAQDVETFADGLVQMAEFEIAETSPVADQTVEEADRYESLTFAAILRDDDVVIPRGETVLEPGDDVIVIGSQESVHTFAHEIAPDVDGARNVLVVGGSDVGYHTARLLQDRGLKPRLVEQNHERARELAEELEGTTVLESDATDREFLEREHVADVDIVVAALDNDEKNLLASLLAKRLGANRAVAVVDSGAYVPLFEAVGVDVAVNPREATAEEITRFTREHQAENVAIIESDRAEVLEIEVGPESVLADRPIRESVDDLPEGVVIGAITRDGELVIPRGDTVIQQGDHVVLFVDAESLDAASTVL
ncbi:MULTISPECIES: Trk system potassium transporter TrkA [Haloarcula]|uniref:Trk system potassium transport protein TrkA n=1 Tax=Haloarcula pellucida TaxID=1427151 RepID=A0A830GMM0_9EURY|nr:MULTISPECIES: Trk system potassium transporter TrkA [Halomicroarcula]MBX0348194.1 Trk system potassium transporter TrkA [Halomicroarcula pellucida]MDS0278049.1 Trk system potassium transporter TrkA [Halomicroarcula sp. S1AR25-4]GGN97411.1 Trk system potassium transport protein TrkA [Halomicroarcula pellucida]